MSQITVTINGQNISMPAGSVVATAVMAAQQASRHSISGQPRAPLCGMGICYECRVTINGQPHQLSCQIACEDGMQIETT